MNSNGRTSTPCRTPALISETRSGLPPLPPPVDYKTVASQLSKDRFDFLATPNWAFTHSGGTLYLSEKSKLKLSLPMVLTAYEDLASGKVVLTGSMVDSKKIETLAVVDAPEFAEQKSGQTLESWLMKEIGPRRIIWTAVLKPEEDAWADLLSVQSEPLAAPMMMTMSVPETIAGFRIVQDGTNLSVNLPVEFTEATITLQSCSNLVNAAWSSVLQTNAATNGLMFLGSVVLPDSIGGGSSTNSGGVEIPVPGETNAISSNVTNNSVAVFYRVNASSTVDSDNDGLDNVSEYGAGTDYQDSDSDNDALTDGDEVSTYGLDPLSRDTNGDGVPDAIDANMQGTTGEEGVLIVLPNGEYRHMPESLLNLNSYGAYGQ